MEYLITPRIPGVRPQDPPDYDGITFVYLFTNVVDPWVVPPQLQNVVLVVENAQGFVAGMSIIIEGAGSFQVVSTDALNRMTVQNLGYSQNVAPGTGIAPGKITTTSLPGPKGDTGIQGIQGLAATIAVGTTITSPAGQNANVVNAGTASAALLNFTIPRGLVGPQGAQGPPGQAYSNTTTAAFTAAAPPTVQTLSLQNTTGLFAGVTLNINPIGYYQVSSVLSGTQVSVVNTGVTSNAAPGTLAPSGSPVLGTGPQGPPGNTGAQGPAGTNGATGPQGPAGANGATGAPGTAATITAGTTTTGAPGTQASVTAVGTPQAQVFNFQIPQGAAGATGSAGAPGTPGAAGATGPQGPAGAAATLTAGTTSTSAPGSNATVTAVGTSSAQVFNFAIPRGDIGAQGPAGATGPTGPQGAPGINSLATTTANGLLTQVSGNTTDFVDGTNNCHAMGPVIVGAPAGTPAPPSAILVPRYATHPDAIWTPLGAFDDHFSGTTLNAKWTQVSGSSPVAGIDASGPQIYVSDSRLCINGVAAINNDILYYSPYVQQTLPNANPFTLTFQLDVLALVNATNNAAAPGTSSQAGFYLTICTSSGVNYARFNIQQNTGTNNTWYVRTISWWTSNGVTVGSILSDMPRYIRAVFQSNYQVSFYISMNGKHWMAVVGVSGAQSGFSASVLPSLCQIGCQLYNYGGAELSIDWIKFTNP